MASRFFPTSTTFTTLLFLLFATDIVAQESTINIFQTITTTAGNAATSFAPSASSATSTSEPISSISSSTSSISPSPTPVYNQSSRDGGFQYYSIIIAGAVACFVLFFIFMARRRKTRALLVLAQTQRALSQDTAGYRSPRYGRGWNPSDNSGAGHTISSRMRMMGRRREEVPEGLNEAGEAPPPYMPGSKPPSLLTNDGDLEMGEMRRPVPKPKEGELPPGYGLEHGGESSEVVARPETAVVRP